LVKFVNFYEFQNGKSPRQGGRFYSSFFSAVHLRMKQESRAVARKPRDAAAVLFGLKYADNIHYKLKSSQASKARLQSSKHTGTKQNLTQNAHSRSFKVTFWSQWKDDKVLSNTKCLC